MLKQFVLLVISFLLTNVRCDIGGWESLGCWRDLPTRAIASLEGKSKLLNGNWKKRSNPLHACSEAAANQSLKAFAVQDGGQCFGGPYAQLFFDQYGPSNLCKNGVGGIWSNNVYSSKTSYRQVIEDKKSNEKIVRCDKPLDLVFLLDGAGPPSTENKLRWNEMLSFVSKATEMFNKDSTRFGVISFGSKPKVVLNMTHINDEMLIRDQIANTKFPGGNRKINDALKEAWKEHFKNDKRTSNKAILTLTTGNLDYGPWGSSLFLTNKGIRVLAFGIDKAPSYRYLETIASWKHPENIYSLDSDQLDKALPFVAKDICTGGKKTKIETIRKDKEIDLFGKDEFETMGSFIERKSNKNSAPEVRSGSKQEEKTEKSEDKGRKSQAKAQSLEEASSENNVGSNLGKEKKEENGEEIKVRVLSGSDGSTSDLMTEGSNEETTDDKDITGAKGENTTEDKDMTGVKGENTTDDKGMGEVKGDVKSEQANENFDEEHQKLNIVYPIKTSNISPISTTSLSDGDIVEKLKETAVESLKRSGNMTSEKQPADVNSFQDNGKPLIRNSSEYQENKDGKSDSTEKASNEEIHSNSSQQENPSNVLSNKSDKDSSVNSSEEQLYSGDGLKNKTSSSYSETGNNFTQENATNSFASDPVGNWKNRNKQPSSSSKVQKSEREGSQDVESSMENSSQEKKIVETNMSSYNSPTKSGYRSTGGTARNYYGSKMANAVNSDSTQSKSNSLGTAKNDKNSHLEAKQDSAGKSDELNVKGDESKVKSDESKVKGVESKVKGDESKVKGDESKVKSDESKVDSSSFGKINDGNKDIDQDIFARLQQQRESIDESGDHVSSNNETDTAKENVETDSSDASDANSENDPLADEDEMLTQRALEQKKKEIDILLKKLDDKRRRKRRKVRHHSRSYDNMSELNDEGVENNNDNLNPNDNKDNGIGDTLVGTRDDDGKSSGDDTVKVTSKDFYGNENSEFAMEKVHNRKQTPFVTTPIARHILLISQNDSQPIPKRRPLKLTVPTETAVKILNELYKLPNKNVALSYDAFDPTYSSKEEKGLSRQSYGKIIKNSHRKHKHKLTPKSRRNRYTTPKVDKQEFFLRNVIASDANIKRKIGKTKRRNRKYKSGSLGAEKEFHKMVSQPFSQFHKFSIGARRSLDKNGNNEGGNNELRQRSGVTTEKNQQQPRSEFVDVHKALDDYYVYYVKQLRHNFGKSHVIDGKTARSYLPNETVFHNQATHASRDNQKKFISVDHATKETASRHLTNKIPYMANHFPHRWRDVTATSRTLNEKTSPKKAEMVHPKSMNLSSFQFRSLPSIETGNYTIQTLSSGKLFVTLLSKSGNLQTFYGKMKMARIPKRNSKEMKKATLIGLRASNKAINKGKENDYWFLKNDWQKVPDYGQASLSKWHTGLSKSGENDENFQSSLVREQGVARTLDGHRHRKIKHGHHHKNVDISPVGKTYSTFTDRNLHRTAYDLYNNKLADVDKPISYFVKQKQINVLGNHKNAEAKSAITSNINKDEFKSDVNKPEKHNLRKQGDKSFRGMSKSSHNLHDGIHKPRQRRIGYNNKNTSFTDDNSKKTAYDVYDNKFSFVDKPISYFRKNTLIPDRLVITERNYPGTDLSTVKLFINSGDEASTVPNDSVGVRKSKSPEIKNAIVSDANPDEFAIDVNRFEKLEESKKDSSSRSLEKVEGSDKGKQEKKKLTKNENSLNKMSEKQNEGRMREKVENGTKIGGKSIGKGVEISENITKKVVNDKQFFTGKNQTNSSQEAINQANKTAKSDMGFKENAPLHGKEHGLNKEDGGEGDAWVFESNTKERKWTKTASNKETKKIEEKKLDVLDAKSAQMKDDQQFGNEQSLVGKLGQAVGCTRPVKVLYAIDVSDAIGTGPSRQRKWEHMKRFLRSVNDKVTHGGNMGYIVYDTEPRFISNLEPCDTKTEYFVTSGECLCDKRSSSFKEGMSSCSTHAPTDDESIEDWGKQGPRTAKALQLAQRYFHDDAYGDSKKLIVLITHQSSTDDVTVAERSLKNDSISLVDIEIGERHNMRKRSNRFDDIIPRDHQMEVSFYKLDKAIENIFMKICKENDLTKTRRSKIYATVNHHRNWW